MSMKFVRPGVLDGICRAPSSKSEFQRAVAAAFFAGAGSGISFDSLCEDSRAALGVAIALGASIRVLEHAVLIEAINLEPAAVLDCGESGLCFRMFAPIAALYDRKITLTGRGSLLHRPVGGVEAALKGAGVRCQSRGGLPPLTVHGPLRPGRFRIDGSLSSQPATGLLMALPLLKGDSELRLDRVRSIPYLKLTLAVMRAFGVSVDAENDFERFFIPGFQRYRPCTYPIEGDWSAAAFLLVAGAIAGKVTVSGLNLESTQADRQILGILDKCGVKISYSDRGITSSRSRLKAFDFDAKDAPDLVPPLAALACFCRGLTRIRGVERLRHKESDRAKSLIHVLGPLGAQIRVEGDVLEIVGSEMKGGTVDSHNDHRIAMAAAVAALGSREGVMIGQAECVAKSYPRFFEDLERLRMGE